MAEQCFLAATACCPGEIPLGTMFEQIPAVGAEHVVLSSDLGQVAKGLPPPRPRRRCGRGTAGSWPATAGRRVIQAKLNALQIRANPAASIGFPWFGTDA